MLLCTRLNETEGLSLEQLENSSSKKLKKNEKDRMRCRGDVEKRRVVGVERRGGEKGVEQ